MNRSEIKKVIKRIREVNPNHILFKFIEPNIGKTIAVDHKEGIVINPTANAEIFKFGINIMTSAPDEVPEYSNIRIMDSEGNFIPDDDFCDKFDIAMNIGLDDVSIDDYVSLKLMIEENIAYAKSYAGYIKMLNEAGFSYDKNTYTSREKKDKLGITVPAFKVEIDHPYNFDGKLEAMDEVLNVSPEMSMKELNTCTEARNKIMYKINPSLTFLTRCIEYRMYHNNFHIITEGIENDYKMKGKRIKWQRLPNALEKIDIRFRDYTKKV